MGDRSYGCSECNDTFIRKSQLSKHHMTHTGEKKYQCCDCEEVFFKKSELIRHQKCHLGKNLIGVPSMEKLSLEGHSS